MRSYVVNTALSTSTRTGEITRTGLVMSVTSTGWAMNFYLMRDLFSKNPLSIEDDDNILVFLIVTDYALPATYVDIFIHMLIVECHNNICLVISCQSSIDI